MPKSMAAAALSARQLIKPIRSRAGHVRCFAATADPTSKLSNRGVSESQRLFDDLKRKFGYMGLIDKRKVGAQDLVNILKAGKSPNDYRCALQAMNVYYNFGVKLKHGEIASRYLAGAMKCKVYDEAVELIKLYGTWLESPPEISLVYSVMSHYLDAGSYTIVRDIAQTVREDWRMPVEAPLYDFAMEAMLRLNDDGLDEALLLHQDAKAVGVRLPAKLHLRLLNAALESCSTSASAEDGGEGEVAETDETSSPSSSSSSSSSPALRTAVFAAEGLIRDGHLLRGGNAATMVSTAWLLRHLEAVPSSDRDALLSEAGAAELKNCMGGSWRDVLLAATEDFRSKWGFSDVLPAGLFKALEASEDPLDIELVATCRKRFGRFYPS